jgi:hypothetical protein
MRLKTLHFVTLLFVAPVMGTSFAHALGVPPKMRVPGPVWLTFQHTLYANLAVVGGVVEIGSIVTATMLAYRQPALLTTVTRTLVTQTTDADRRC